MSVVLNNPSGSVDIANEVIASIVGSATTEVSGVVGMTSVNAVKDNVRTILRQENFSRGVLVRNDSAGTSIDVYIVVSYGVKISEVAKNVQERIRFSLESQVGISGAQINVFVQSVKVVNS